MSLRHETATAWADDLSAAVEPRLGILEAYALQRHPDALQHMGEDGAGLARVAAAKGSGMAGLWLVLPALLAIVAPVIGFAAVVGDPAGFHRMEASTSVPIAGVCFAIAAVVQLVAAIWWLRSGRARHYMLFILAFGTAVLGAATWWVMGAASSFDGFDGAAAWRVPVLIASVLGAAYGVLMLALGRPAGVDEAAAPAGGDGLHAALAAIPGDELREIRADRDAALARLVERGKLSAEVAGRAARAELGTLHRL
ncbi:hypothetical protein [Agrococcus beijingensis]|uniref:hypothetical protein n=1 Tax=Agrococcus beijingensis TaxID=3068634 RepID=UPI00274229B9|nr:hypothetical protein [Agrococcus sp. REN33]